MQVHGVELIDECDMVLKHQELRGVPFEAESIAAWRSACREDRWMVDVGAYTGVYSLIAAAHGARVLAFEPNPRVYDRLRQNVAQAAVQERISALRMAVSDHMGLAHFVDKPDTPLTSAGRIEDGKDVTRVTLDSFRLPHLAAIKIDVEGHEIPVLVGAWKTLTRCRPLIITEALTGSAFNDQQGLLGDLGYVGEQVDERNVIWRIR